MSDSLIVVTVTNIGFFRDAITGELYLITKSTMNGTPEQIITEFRVSKVIMK